MKINKQNIYIYIILIFAILIGEVIFFQNEIKSKYELIKFSFENKNKEKTGYYILSSDSIKENLFDKKIKYYNI